MASRFGGRAPAGLLFTAVIAIVLAVGFDLNAIASIGSAVALVVFALIGIGHLRIRRETGANAALLVLGILAAVVVLVMFLPTLAEEQATLSVIVAIVVLSVVLDFLWKRSRGDQPPAPDSVPAG